MNIRRALLIGVPENTLDPSLNLQVVGNDIAMMQSSLEACGYAVTSIGIAASSIASANLIRHAIAKACSEAPENSTLLLYFSGHGVHVNGEDLLIPWDGSITDPETIRSSLVSTNILSSVNRSRARVVLFIIDACREGGQWDIKPAIFQGWGSKQIKTAQQRHFILFYSCGPGEFSHYVSGPDGFSLFSKALSTVLSPSHPAESIDEVVSATEIELTRLVRECKKTEQHCRIVTEHEPGSRHMEHKISDGQFIEGGVRSGNIAWADSFKECRLWRLTGTADKPGEYSLREAANRLIATCEKEWVKAEQAIRNDPWRDYSYPQRVLACLDLLAYSIPQFSLSDIEAFTLTVSPFIREAVYGCAVATMADAKPLNLSDRINNNSSKLRRRLMMTHASHPQLIRKAQQDQNKATGQAIALWLMHRSIQRDPNTWQSSPDGYISSDFDDTLTSYRETIQGPVLKRSQLIEFALCIGCDPGRIERTDRKYTLNEKIVFDSKGNSQELREQLMGYLLCIAGWMALDIRSMPEILADHIGVADPVRLESLHKSLGASNWKAIGAGRTLQVQCDHPAIDYAFRDVVRHANESLAFVHTLAATNQGAIECLGSLPNRLTPDMIKPRMLDGKVSYETPHLTFQLANDEVRELLMGEALYDKPELAIRELYQNALDACRYRRARLQYLERTVQLESENNWEGKIEFEQGHDKRNRPFLECCDNGIGMGRREVEACFAKAGKRFSDLPEFIEEQNEWIRCKPPISIYPNSQFGIGVFSYFMLANELEIETCRLDRKGRPGMRLLITIPGSGSLFRIQELGPGKEAGTRVRLYLRNSKTISNLSCIRALESFLWVSEFQTKAKHKLATATWEPETLYHPNNKTPWKPDAFRFPFDRKVKILKNPYRPIWWTTGKGQVLADGIAVHTDSDRITELLECGIVVNLTGEYKPKLTVDRRKARDLDTNWVLNSVRDSIKYLVEWEGLSYVWIWMLLTIFPEWEHFLHQELSSRNRIIPFTGIICGREIILRDHYGHRSIEEKVFDLKNKTKLGIYSRLSLREINPHFIGLSKVRVADVGIKRSDAHLWKVVLEVWNFELAERHIWEGEEGVFQLWRNSLLFLEKAEEKETLLDLQIKVSNWSRNQKTTPIARLQVWRRAGLILPRWFEIALDELATGILKRHYALRVIPKSRLAWRRVRNKIKYFLSQVKLRWGRAVIVLILLGALIYVVLGTIALLKTVFL